MKKFVLVLVLAGVAALIWYIASRLSADAIGMAIGILLGVLAGLPAAILVMASNRRRSERDERPQGRNSPYGLPAHASPNAPIIVLAGNGYPNGQSMQGHPADPYNPQMQRPALPGPQMQMPPQERQFKVVGESEEWVDEW